MLVELSIHIPYVAFPDEKLLLTTLLSAPTWIPCAPLPFEMLPVMTFRRALPLIRNPELVLLRELLPLSVFASALEVTTKPIPPFEAAVLPVSMFCNEPDMVIPCPPLLEDTLL